MINVYTSTIIAVPAGQVWQRVSDFNGMPNWHPAVTDSKIEDGFQNGQIGCVRNFGLAGGSDRIRETLLAISSTDRSMTYNMLPNGPLPFVNYIAKMKFTPITDRDETFAEWWADFEAGDGDDAKWSAFVANDVFLGGFRALEDSFK